MSLHQPFFVFHGLAATVAEPPETPPNTPFLGDRHQRLFEAETLGCCAEGDLLALMPSADLPPLPWRDETTWLRRILGF